MYMHILMCLYDNRYMLIGYRTRKRTISTQRKTPFKSWLTIQISQMTLSKYDIFPMESILHSFIGFFNGIHLTMFYCKWSGAFKLDNFPKRHSPETKMIYNAWTKLFIGIKDKQKNTVRNLKLFLLSNLFSYFIGRVPAIFEHPYIFLPIKEIRQQ